MSQGNGRNTHRAQLEDYERRRREVAEHAVLDAAEDVLGHAWIGELDRERRTSVAALEAAAEVVVAARRLLRIAESDGNAAQVRSARVLYTQADKDLARTLAQTQATLTSVDGRLRTIREASLARLRLRRADTERVRAARLAMGDEAPD